MLAAVNLGGDTDTIAAITGGMAGVLYGISDIPDSWLQTLKKKEAIFELSKQLYTKCGATQNE